jgi:uncharacterized membrane protein
VNEAVIDRELPGRGRTEAFSDGVIAIAITLLVLDINVPVVGPHQSLAHALAHLWPKYAAFAVAFVTIGIMWINHHALFQHVARVDRRLSFINLGVLMAIAFVPFPTAVFGDYIQSATNGRIAAAIFGLNMLLVGVGFVALWLHLRAHPELRVPASTDERIAGALRRTIVGPICYVVAIAVSFISPYAALAVYASVAIYFSADQFTRDS